AEEVVQTTFFKLWKYRHTLNEELPLVTQLFRIARTTLINELKKLQHARVYNNYKQYSSAEGYEHIVEETSYIETQLRLKLVVEMLPPVRKKVFELSRFHYLSHKEISQRLSLSRKTIETHINLALKF